MEGILLEFQLYLNERRLITNHDWDYLKEARRFLIKKELETLNKKL